MLAFAAETTKPPAYPFITSNSQRAQKNKISRGASFLALPSPLVSRLSALAFAAATVAPGSAFPHPVRFGESVFTKARQGPQVEKSGLVVFSSQTPVSLNFSPVSSPASRGLSTAPPAAAPIKRLKSCDSNAACHPAQANPGTRCVIRPPHTVSAIPIAPTRSGAVASMSPSSRTRSPASPGTSRPVTWSRCAAHAPPAV